MLRIPARAVRLACVAAAAAALCTASAFAGGADASPGEPSAADAADTTDQLIVRYRKGSAAETRDDAPGRARGHEVADRAGLPMRLLRRDARRAAVMKLDERVAVARLDELARAMEAADPDIESVEPDRLMRPAATPNDPRYLDQWHYHEATAGLRLPAAWDLSTGSGVVVAVVDTGWRPHPDLAPAIVGGHDMIANATMAHDGGGRDADAKDPGDGVAAGECGSGSPAANSSWHGTHVAGTIAAATNNAVGVAGVAHGAKVLPVRALGKCGGYTSDIADAITWATGGTVTGVPANPHRARVVNLSLGGAGACSTTTQAAINGARSRGAVVVVAAGNSAADAGGFSPANCAGVVSVAAVGRSGARAAYSNHGAGVDLAAPGGDMRAGATGGVLSTANTGTTTPGADSYAWYQGTSMATPHVAGVAALLLSRHPALTPDQVESALKTSARAFPAACAGCGSGIVDASAALRTAATLVAGASATAMPVAEVEPNGTIGTAQPVSANPATLSGSIASTADVDWYRLSVGAGRTLTATLPGSTSADFDLYLHDAGGSGLASSALHGAQTDTLAWRNAGAAAVVVNLRVHRYAGTGAYALSVSQ